MIYLDSAATTRPSDAVAGIFDASSTKYYANPDSSHAAGMQAGKQIENARAAVAGVLKAQPEEIIFTSSGTEANNLAIFGTCDALKKYGNKIIISDSEHPSVYMPAKELEKRGFEIIYLSSKGGIINLDEFRQALDERVILVSVMLVNNETGAIYNLNKINETVQTSYKNAAHTPHIHTDAVQAFGKININLNKLKVNMLTASAHKIHGIKGAGCLYLRKNTRINAQIFGGGQERGLRSSTLNTPSILAFGKAAEQINIQADYEIIENLYDYAVLKIKEKCPDVKFNQNGEFSKYILSLRLPNVRSEIMLNYLSSRDIYISSGAACSSKNTSTQESVRVLLNYGLDKFSADFTVRVSFSKYNKIEEIDEFISVLAEGISKFSVY